MATTDARPGFKLPWSTDRSESDSTPAAEAAPPGVSEEQTAATVEPVDGPPSDQTTTEEAPTTPDGSVGVGDSAVSGSFDPWRLAGASPAPVDAGPKRKPNKLMADLTRAMQTAAETARDETLARLQTDAKEYIEGIHARSASEAEELRQTAEGDIGGIREWSKAEITRIREETDQKVTDRKARLDDELEEHAARIERRIEQVQNHVAWFETEMAGFFERLLAEEDPTHLAAMAESLPEPPSFDELQELPAPARQTAAAGPADRDAAAEPVAVDAPSVSEIGDVAEPDPVSVAEMTPKPVDDPETSFAAIQAAAEAAEAGEPVEGTFDQQGDTVEHVPGEPSTEAVDQAHPGDAAEPRLAMIGFETPVEGDAPTVPVEDIPVIPDDALAARLAGLVPGDDGAAPHEDLRTTRVVVSGLVSVASIASFKRHLGKIEGVASVGVSSGPDGEFVFAVSHGPAIDFHQALPALPGFAAQITSATDDTVSVAARDPETET